MTATAVFTFVAAGALWLAAYLWACIAADEPNSRFPATVSAGYSLLGLAMFAAGVLWTAEALGWPRL